MIPIALTIAGSDPSGGAGIQADLKTFHQFGVYGMSVLTLLTVQNTCRVSAVQSLPAQFVLQQLDALLDDFSPGAAKTGALGSREVIEAIAERAARFSFPLVVDPIMVSKHGASMMDEDARAVLAQRLLPHAYLVTPNLQEAIVLSGRECKGLSSLEEAAKAIADLGPRAVLVKGGHLPSDALARRPEALGHRVAQAGLAEEATDILFTAGRFHSFPARRITTKHTHGTGCTYSAAITAQLAKGVELIEAVRTAKQFITRAIETSPGLGHGSGPVNHMAPTD